MHTYIVRYSEIALKGGNTAKFEQALIRNIQLLDVKVRKRRMGILVESDGPTALDCVFGIVSYSLAERTDIDALPDKAIALLKDKTGTFRIDVNRADKTFPKSSQDVAREIGSAVCEGLGLKVDLSNADHTVYIDIAQDGVFIYTEKEKGAGGLPVGVSGDVYLDTIVSEQDALAAWLMMKRGCKVYVKKGDGALLEKLELWNCGAIGSAVPDDAVLLSSATLENYSGHSLAPLIAYTKESIKKRFARL